MALPETIKNKKIICDLIIMFRWVRLILSLFIFISFIIVVFNRQTFIYLFHQAMGQLSILVSTQSIDRFCDTSVLSIQEKENIALIETIKKYSIDSLAYSPTENFTRIYDQKNTTTLWVITACQPYSFDAYEWHFPIVGNVTYKGFFKRTFADKERMHLLAKGYDVDIRGVSAWSTLGWFSDPLLSSMLKRSKGSLCNLLFHELFHATYFAANSVDFNENIASFIAHKATLQFLKNDTSELNDYKQNHSDNITFSN
jgi:predicted aminopeptidase